MSRNRERARLTGCKKRSRRGSSALAFSEMAARQVGGRERVFLHGGSGGGLDSKQVVSIQKLARLHRECLKLLDELEGGGSGK